MGQFCQKVPRDIEKEQSEYSGFFYIHRDSEQAVLNPVPKIYEQTLSVVHCQIVITAGQVYRITQSDGLSFFDCTKKEKEKYTAMKGKEKTSLYQCLNCGWTMPAEEQGEEPDHCPNCLSGIHREDREGIECGGILEPVGIWVRSENEWEIVQRCRFCGEMRTSPMTEQDNRIKILSIASKPISAPPFPLERIEELTRIMGGSGDTGGNRK